MAATGRKRPRQGTDSGIKFSARLTSLASEDQVAAFYGIQFCPFGDAFRDYVAASVYLAPQAGGLNPVLAFIDEDTEEDYYALAWLVHWREAHVLIAVAGERGSINVINCHTHKRCRLLAGHGNAVNALCAHPKNPVFLFSCSKDESIRLWNVRTGTCAAIFAGHGGHRDEVLSIDVHVSGDRFASCGMDNTIRVWSLAAPAVGEAMLDSEFWDEPDEPEVVAAAPAGQSASEIARSILEASPHAAPGLGTAADLDAAAQRVKDRKRRGAPFRTLSVQLPAFTTRRVHSDYVDAVTWLGDALVTKSTEGRIVAWRPDLRFSRDGVCVLKTFHLPDASIWFVRHALSEDLSLLACGNKHGTVHVWTVDGHSTRPVFVLKPAQCKVPVRHVAFSPDSFVLIAVSDDGCVWRWDFVPERDGAVPVSEAPAVSSAAAAATK